MKNFVATYQLADDNTRSELEKRLQSSYPAHQREARHGLNFFAFAAKNEQAATSSIKDILNGRSLDDYDFVALFYNDEKVADQRVRIMLIGRDTYLENRIGGDFSSAEFDTVLTDLLQAQLKQ